MLQEKLSHLKLILASSSPRRKILLEELHLPFSVEVFPVEEHFPPTLQKEEITTHLVKLKADAFRKLMKNEVVITGDTIVWSKVKALNKPNNKAEAIQMLEELSGETHQVISSVGVTGLGKQIIKSDEVDVCFKELTQQEIKFYVEHYQPYDKAGAYGIQEWIGKIGITAIHGSFYTVMGLPVHLLYEALQDIAAEW